MDDAVRLCQGLGERARGQESGLGGGAPAPLWLRHGELRAEEASGAKEDRGGLLELAKRLEVSRWTIQQVDG